MRPNTLPQRFIALFEKLLDNAFFNFGSGLVRKSFGSFDPDLEARDESGKPYSVRYEAVNAMLLHEFLKEHRKVERLEATCAAQQKGFESQQKQSQTTAAQQQKEIEALTAALKAQATQIQKVCADRDIVFVGTWTRSG